MNDDWRWTCTPPTAWAAPLPNHPSQDEAERWLGQVWQEMADAGVEAVTLHHGADVVYGPMSLQELE